MESGRLLARTLRDVTNVRGADLRDERFVPHIVSEPAPIPVPAADVIPAECQVICVASGKGGTGKSVVTTNLACALAQDGFRVLLFDADMGLANAHMLMGVTPQQDLSAVVGGRAKLADVVVDCPAGVRLVCGGSGFSHLAELSYGKLNYLAGEIGTIEAEADIMLVDAAAGIGSQVMRFLKAAHDIVVVTMPDVTALLDAYALLKSLSGSAGNVKLIVNRARERAEAVEAFKKLTAVTARHLDMQAISFFGWIPAHWYVQDSVRLRLPVMLSHPKSAIAASIRQMAQRLGSAHREWVRRQRAGIEAREGQDEGPAEAFSARLAKIIFE